MGLLKEFFIGLGYCSMAVVGSYGTYLVNKQGVSDYYKIATYAVTGAGLYLLTSHLLDDTDQDPVEKKKEETSPITAQSVMEHLRPALQKQIDASTRTKARVEKLERKLTELEEDSKKAGKQPTDEPGPSNENDKLTNFQRILQNSSDPSAFRNLTDPQFIELMNEIEELPDSEKEHVPQIHPIYMKCRKLDIKFQGSFESDDAKEAYLDGVGDQLKKLGHEMVEKGVTEETFYFSDEGKDPDDTLDAARYENCSSDAESDDNEVILEK